MPTLYQEGSSDEGRLWVNYPQPSVSLYGYNPVDQWHELENLSRLLLHTPFRAHDVITEISSDANGTRHLTLHSQPDGLTLWHSLLMTPLLATGGTLGDASAQRHAVHSASMCGPGLHSGYPA